MIELKKCAGSSVYVLKNILSQKQCDYFINEFASINELQIIKEMPEVSSKLWSFISSKISSIEFSDIRAGRNFQITSLKEYISITKARFGGAGKHVDEQFGGDTFKMFFYLNKLSANGGTDFYEKDSDNKVSVNNEVGYGVLFDIGLEHGSQSFPSGEIKHVIGVRPNINYVK